MNFLLSLDGEEIGWLQDKHAEYIGQCDDAECDRHMKRIEQLEGCKPSLHYMHAFERSA